eukprot:SM000300S11725  [mRNA]  locus=s300:118746:119960:- [translate_table: standard]
MRDGGVVASVGDAAVRARDVALLRSRPPAWLNDALLALYLQRLQLSAAAPAVLLVAPAVAAWLRLCRDASDLRAAASALHLPSRDLVLFPVNDNDEPDVPEGGTHWSLLMYYRLDGAFTHLDSLGDANRLPAQALVDVIAPFLGVPQAKRLCVPDFTPQQCNGYECGDFVLAMAEAIVTAHINGQHPLSTLRTSNFIGRVSNLREDFYQLVQELQQERAKRVA